MEKTNQPVLGVIARRARPTMAGAFWLASVVSIPLGCIALVIELALRWLL